MKNIRIKDMINSNINAKLIRSTIKQFGGFESFKKSAQDVYNHGINCGFTGFIYYSDTVDFYKRNKKQILEMAASQAEDFGEDVLTMLSCFNCMKDYPANDIFKACIRFNDDYTSIYNCLAWYAGEEVCKLYVDLLEEE